MELGFNAFEVTGDDCTGESDFYNGERAHGSDIYGTRLVNRGYD